MFIKKILPILAFAVFTTQPLFAADSSTSDTPTTGASSMDSSASAPSTTDHGKCGCAGKHMMKMIKSLQLTDAQKDKIKAIREKTKASLKDSKDQLRSIRGQMHSLITSSSLDNAKLDALISQKTTIIANIIRAKAIAKNQIYNTLTPEQQQKFRQMMQQMIQDGPHHCH